MMRLVSAIRVFAKEFLYTEEARDCTSGHVPTRPGDMNVKVYVAVP
jgi:hypothetical protein